MRGRSTAPRGRPSADAGRAVGVGAFGGRALGRGALGRGPVGVGALGPAGAVSRAPVVIDGRVGRGERGRAGPGAVCHAVVGGPAGGQRAAAG